MALAPVEGKIPRELAPSLKIFSTVTKPMPSFDGVAFNRGLPVSDNVLSDGIGHSTMVRAWFPQMVPVVPKFEKSDERLRLDFDVYADTVREDGAEVLNAGAKLKPSLIALDTATRGRLLDLFAEYNDHVGAAHVARAEYDLARKEAKKAQWLADASDADSKECTLLVERAALEADRPNATRTAPGWGRRTR